MHAPFLQNIPVLLAWIGIWYRNFWNFSSLAILPYAKELEYFPNYLQQLEMESNGKSINRNGEKSTYATAPVIFGQCGTDFQHSFTQLLCQGTEIVPCDFIAFAKPNYANSQIEKKTTTRLASFKAYHIMTIMFENTPAFKFIISNKMVKKPTTPPTPTSADYCAI